MPMKQIAFYENHKWNLRTRVIQMRVAQFRVIVEPIERNPHFINNAPKEFTDRNAALECARVVAGL